MMRPAKPCKWIRSPRLEANKTISAITPAMREQKVDPIGIRKDVNSGLHVVENMQEAYICIRHTMLCIFLLYYDFILKLSKCSLPHFSNHSDLHCVKTPPGSQAI